MTIITYSISLQILEVSSPSKEYCTDSEEGSDSDDLSEGEPLITVIRSAHLRKAPSVAAQHTEESLPRDDSPSPPADMIGDFADGDADLSNGQEMIASLHFTCPLAPRWHIGPLLGNDSSCN